MIRWLGHLGRCVGTSDHAFLVLLVVFVVAEFWGICTMNDNEIYIP